MRRVAPLAAPDAAAGQLPRVPVAVGVADEDDELAVTDDALHALRVGPADEPPDAQPGVRGPEADAREGDEARTAQPFGAIA